MAQDESIPRHFPQVFDVKPYLNHGVFQELQDKSYFAKVDFVSGTVTRPHAQDIAPETLLAGMKYKD
jgi:Protein of unknown function (DUF2442)